MFTDKRLSAWNSNRNSFIFASLHHQLSLNGNYVLFTNESWFDGVCRFGAKANRFKLDTLEISCQNITIPPRNEISKPVKRLILCYPSCLFVFRFAIETLLVNYFVKLEDFIVKKFNDGFVFIHIVLQLYLFFIKNIA